MQYLELSSQTRTSLLRGLLEQSWHRPGADPEAELCVGEVVDAQAHADGVRLRRALDGLIAAVTFADLNVAEQVYDDLARELNARYGDGLVVLIDEGLEPGLRGFRGQGFATRSSLLVGEERVAS